MSTARINPAPAWELLHSDPVLPACLQLEDLLMNGIIYLVGLIVVVLAILSFLGLR